MRLVADDTAGDGGSFSLVCFKDSVATGGAALWSVFGTAGSTDFAASETAGFVSDEVFGFDETVDSAGF
jgi:hypothetical protein